MYQDNIFKMNLIFLMLFTEVLNNTRLRWHPTRPQQS